MMGTECQLPSHVWSALASVKLRGLAAEASFRYAIRSPFGRHPNSNQRTVIKSGGNFTLHLPPSNAAPSHSSPTNTKRVSHLFPPCSQEPLRIALPPQPPHACSTSPTRQVSTGRLMTSILNPRSCCMRPSQLPGLDHFFSCHGGSLPRPLIPRPSHPFALLVASDFSPVARGGTMLALSVLGQKEVTGYPHFCLPMFPLVHHET
ncbi:hypothetical protein IWZ00DRAFT_126107 [Phyllosticta capitalensis]